MRCWRRQQEDTVLPERVPRQDPLRERSLGSRCRPVFRSLSRRSQNTANAPTPLPGFAEEDEARARELRPTPHPDRLQPR
jgi:hypothetical protein